MGTGNLVKVILDTLQGLHERLQIQSTVLVDVQNIMQKIN